MQPAIPHKQKFNFPDLKSVLFLTQCQRVCIPPSIRRLPDSSHTLTDRAAFISDFTIFATMAALGCLRQYYD